MTVAAPWHAGGVLEISRWQAPKARRHRIGVQCHTTPEGSRTPAPRRGAMIDHLLPGAARRWRLPPANLQHASGVPVLHAGKRVGRHGNVQTRAVG